MRNPNEITMTMTIDGVEVDFIRKGSAPEPSTVDGLEYAIVRSREQGVMCGYVESIEGRTVTLRHARQIWRYDSTFVLPDIAEKGVRNVEACKFSVAMSQPMIMLEACGVITCTKIGAESLQSVPETVK